MSTPPDILSQILQGGLMNYPGQSPLDQGLMASSPTSNLGAQLLANSNTPGRFGSLLGKSILGAQQQAQQNAAQQMSLLGQGQDLRMKALQQQMFMQAYPSWLGALTGQTPGQPGQSPQQAPQAQQGSPQGGTGQPVGIPGGQPPGQQTQGQDPFAMLQQGMLGAALGMPGAKEMIDVAKTRLQYDPNLQTKIEAAKSDVAKDQELISQALKSGDTATAWGMTQKLQQDMGLVHIASMSGTQTRITPQGIYTLNPTTGMESMNGNVRLAPGAAQAFGSKEAAEAQGRATGELTEVTDKDGNKYRVPVSTLLGGGGGAAGGVAPAAPSSAPAPSAPGNLAALGPQQSSYLGGRGTHAVTYLTGQQNAADAARDTNYSIDQMLDAASHVQLGPGAATRQWTEKWLSGLGQQFGVEPSSELANYTELEKYANKIAFAATKQMGSREAAQIVTLQMQSNPNKSMVPEAFQGVAQSMKAMNNYIIDKNVVMQKSGAEAQNAAAKWTQEVDPRVWALTLSPEMGKKWGSQISPTKIVGAMQYMTPEEQRSLVANLPTNVLKQLQ